MQIDVGYIGGLTARYEDQIVTTLMTQPGDSGSLLMALDLPMPSNAAVGLLFASTNPVPVVPNPISVANRIQHVRELLRVETGEGLF
jgi:hypothetical protein